MITLRQLWQPSFYLTCLMLGCVTLLCSLGYWQLSREQQKMALIDQLTASSSQPLLAIEGLSRMSPDELRFRKLILTGTFLNERSILIDNKMNNGKVGYHVLTPFTLSKVLPNHPLMLVNRGWVPLGRTRSVLPKINFVSGEVTIEGTLDFVHRNPLISMPIENSIISWPLRMQNCDVALLQEILAKPIYPLMINLEASSPFAFESFQLSKTWLSPERHRGYAIQWFACALMLVFLYSFYFWRYYRK